MLFIASKITEKEVNDVLNVFDMLSFSRGYQSEMMNTPYYINELMKNINMNPIAGTVEDIKQALKSPKTSEQILRGYSENFENTNMYYKRLLSYIPDLLSFNMTFTVMGDISPEEFQSDEFKKDIAVLQNFSEKMNFKEEFGRAMRQIMRQGAYYCVLRERRDKNTLQELPIRFCKITGRHSYGLLFDFDFSWFIGNFGANIDLYPPVFKKMYNNVFKKIGKAYNPAKRTDKRNSSYVFWTQCSPNDGFWVFKSSPELVTVMPYFAPLFVDLSFQDTIRELQQDKNFIAASRLLVGILGMNKDTKSGKVANQMNITPEVLGKFLGLARRGLAKQIGLVALPVDDVKAVDFNVSENNIYSDYTGTTNKLSVASADTLVSDNKLNTHQSKLAAAIDANLAKSFYPMFESFVEFFVNSQTSKYKFKIKFNDVNTPDDKADRETSFENLARMGIVDVQALARTKDMNVFELKKSLEFNNWFNIENKLIELKSLNNQSGKVGRPVSDSDNENTEASRARGSNDERD